MDSLYVSANDVDARHPDNDFARGIKACYSVCQIGCHAVSEVEEPA